MWLVHFRLENNAENLWGYFINEKKWYWLRNKVEKSKLQGQNIISKQQLSELGKVSPKNMWNDTYWNSQFSI